MNFDRIFVLGAGAIGSVYGAFLSKRNDVTLIGNRAHVEARDFEEKTDNKISKYTNFSCMYQDIMKRKRTEIDFQNGRVVELGKKNHIPTPVNETLVSMIKFVEEKNGIPRKN